MYSKKAVLFQRPTRYIIISETPPKTIDIAPPDRIECNPTSSFVNPNISSPIIATIARNRTRIIFESISHMVPLS